MRRVLFVILGLLVVALVALVTTAGFWANWLWFGSLGLRQVLLTRYAAQWSLFAAAGLVAALFFGLNVRYAARQLLKAPVVVQGQQVMLAPGLVTAAVTVGSLIVGGLLGSAAAGQWPTVLAFLNRTDFGITEPINGQDAGFYVFTLPLLDAARSWALGLLTLTLIAVGALAFLRYTQGMAQGRFGLPRDLRSHLSILGALALALFSFSYFLANYNLVYSGRGVVFGASRTDLAAQRPANYILLVLSGLAAVLLAWNAFARRLRPLIVTLGLWAAAAVLVGVLFPAGYQNFIVRPSELRQEEPYIRNNIELTRRAYNLEGLREGQLTGDAPLRADDLRANQETVEDIRIWDYRPLLTTYKQIQRISQYYDFKDVDIDRYTIDGRDVQVTLAARELVAEQLPAQAQTWTNRHLIYTHGYGVVVSPVNRVVPPGLPDLLVKDLPVTGPDALRITRPEIYFGERTDQYVIVNSREREFDRPGGASGQDAYTRYAGTGGVPIDNFLNKAIFAAAFGDSNILLSGSLTGGSRVLYHRQIDDRIRRVAPFLRLDADPYPVILDGRLLWVQDAYTVTDRFPYSTPVGGGVNYIRNSVKITVDAYTGDLRFYAVDESDALLRTYRKIYPDLFIPVSQAPAGLAAHFRYPVDLFNIQAEMYATYHMTNSQVFYNREDLWNIARETYAEQVRPMEPFYVTMRLPGESREEFALILPFTPGGQGRDNMVAWMAARSEGSNYGQLQVHRFPQGKFIYGPQQVEARINQEPEISQQLTLWNQSGSTVIRGNLLVIPLGDTILYVQPLYLQAANSPLPELKRIIVASNQGVVMSDTLQTGLTALAQGRSGTVLAAPGTGPGTAGQVPQGGQGGSGSPPAGAPQGNLAEQALDRYNRAQDALRRGDWTTYGQELAAMESLLRQLAGR
ncbi:MAG: UPF0182 family protein [Chloroflexota bacterium]|nr:UPF0182 family protein [Chloroflexota bacterium]